MRLPLLPIRALACACLAATAAMAQLDDQPVEKDAGVQGKRSARLPTLWIIGDSTVRVGTPGQRGWGDEMAPFFDAARVNVVNRAVGGRSSRTFLTDGRWDGILGEMQAGDVVIMQFGHNDSSPIDEKPPVTRSTRCRGTIRNNSDDTVDVLNILTGKPETVHSYGWYLRHFVTTAKEKGAQAIVCSPIPRKSWSEKDAIHRNGDSWGLWARQAAEQTGAQFVDLNEIIARSYETLGRQTVDTLFGDRGTHTSPEGAKLNARAVLSGLNGLDPNPLAFSLSQAGQDVPAFPKPIVEDDRPVANDSGVAPEMPAQDTIPTLWIAGDSTVKISGGANPMRGWGQEIGAFFDAARINVVNRAIGGRSSRTFYTEGRWQSILDDAKRGDWILIQFGHNDVGRPGASSKFRGSLKGIGDETQDVTKPDGKVETVHTYGWYLKTFARTAREKGANVVLCSPIPHKGFDATGKFQPDWDGWRQWVETCAKETDAYYIDLCSSIARRYARLSQAEIEALYADRGTHTSPAGAKFNAEILVAALQALPGNPLGSCMAEEPGKRTASRFAFADGDEAPGEGVVITADADTCLTNDSDSGPRAARGGEKSMELRRHDGVRQRLLYLRFNLSDVEGDLGGASIVLHLSSANRPRKAGVFGLVDGTTEGHGEDWNERILTYADAAGIDGRAEVGKVGTTAALVGPLTTFSLDKDKTGDTTAGPTRQLDDFLKADSNRLVTFAVMLDFSHGVHDFHFRTREAGRDFAPRLVLPKATATRR